LGIFATSLSSHLALLSSSIHFFWWTTKSELRTDPRYTPSDGFETFPQPELTDRMNRAGGDLDTFRLELTERRRLGLTALYQLVNDEAVHDDDIVQLRDIHVEIDRAVQDAYALDEEREPEIREYEARVTLAPLPTWREIELGHGFHETRQGVRFTISPLARDDVLDKLLALNHFRFQQEEEQGLHNKKGRAASKRRAHGNIRLDGATEFEDGGLFRPGGTLF